MRLLTASNAPLVSIIVINWNNARYIGQAIQSVLAQDYLNIECLVVDNGSTDDSVEVVTDLIADDPRFRLIRFNENLGQLGAFFNVIDQARGEFVSLVDADDLLMPAFISSHVQVHLALARPVAFTSSNVIEIDADGRWLTGGYQAFQRPGSWDFQGLVARSDASLVPTIAEVDYHGLSSAVSVIPCRDGGWFWSPGSANVYRRSVLKIVRQSRTPATDARPADIYLNRLCHALGASAVVDLRLSSYRIHDSNSHSVAPDLAGMRNSRAEFEPGRIAFAQETIDFLIGDVRRLNRLLTPERFWGLIEQIWYGLTDKDLDRSPAFLDSLARHLDPLRAAFGDRALIDRLAVRLRPKDMLRLLGSPVELSRRASFSRRLLTSLARRYAVGLRPQTLANDAVVPLSPLPQGRPPKRDDFGPISVLSDQPPIIKTGICYKEWIGIAGAHGRRFGNSPAGFIIYPTWSIEDPGTIAAIGRQAREHRRRFPDHRLVYMGNTQREADLLAGQGLTSIFLNKNFTVSDRIFRPLTDVEPSFDAVYNARFIPLKRHFLAGKIANLAYLGYLEGPEAAQIKQQAMIDGLLAANPGHALLNPVTDGTVQQLSHADTNRGINRARVGLCLSEIEGSNYASMEYMLAGLAVVSTPSSGGRDVYFDPEFCLVCDPDPDSVRDAVAELVARNIPRDHIRKKTLERVEGERRRFLNLVDDLRRELGGVPLGATQWPYGETSGMIRWGRFDDHLEKIERESAAAQIQAHSTALGDLMAVDLGAIQLQPAELIPVLRAIRAAPRCRLLIFGCGNDSPLWEAANDGGTTVFLEDDEAWIAKARSRLATATVELVHYGTHVRDWPSTLGADQALMLDLPPAIRDATWDVILVDGPAGHQDDLPGRSKSIYTASQLVAQGGKVFVHDCDRPLERDYAAHYLGEQRRFVSVTGRSLLNGYAF